MITGLIVLLACQLVGEFIVAALNLPVPGPVAGMVLLLVVLLIGPREAEASVHRAADGLLHHLQLLFIPAGVGVVKYLSVIGRSALPIVGGLVVSWLAALLATAVSASAALWVLGRARPKKDI